MAKKTSSKTSLAELFDETDPNEASNLLSVGEHTVRITTMEMNDDKKKGVAVRTIFEGQEGDMEGRTISQYYKLADAQGNKAPGMAYLKRDLALLGHEDVTFKKLAKVLKEIEEEQPSVIINVKQNGQYTNAYIQGLAENGSSIESGEKETSSNGIDVGSKVKWTDDDGDELEGEVTAIKKKKATVEDEDGDEHKVDVDDLELVEEEKEEEISVGDKVEWKDADDEECTGLVKKIKGDIATVLDDDSEEKVKVELSDLVKAEADDDDDD